MLPLPLGPMWQQSSRAVRLRCWLAAARRMACHVSEGEYIGQASLLLLLLLLLLLAGSMPKGA